jgi:hypothetical protein
MSEPFSSLRQAGQPRGPAARHVAKIDEAKEQLTSWLMTSSFTRVTVVPFSTRAGDPFTTELPSGLRGLSRYLRGVDAGGTTNMASALRLAIDVGSQEVSNDKIVTHYLLITDGLSDTRPDDIDLASRVPYLQSIDGILIDPTPDGERHIRSLIRGRYLPVYGSEDLMSSFAQQEAEQAYRSEMVGAYNRERDIAGRQLSRLRAAAESAQGTPRGKSASELLLAIAATLERLANFRDALADPNTSRQELRAAIDGLAELDAAAAKLLDRDEPSISFKISLAYPRAFAVGFASTVLVQVYRPTRRDYAVSRMQSTFDETAYDERIADSELPIGNTVRLVLSSPDVDFGEAKRKVISKHGVEGVFWAKPRDTATPGLHTGVLSITDVDGEIEYESLPFQIRIVDYAFDHVSRPRFGQVTSACLAVLAVGALGFVLVTRTYEVIGSVTSALVAVLAGVIAARTNALFSRRSVKVNSRAVDVSGES